LQDKAKPRPFHVVDRVLRLELGAGAEEVFAEFSAEATAAASLAQVGFLL
jgi:ubiquinone biosynthesis protein